MSSDPRAGPVVPAGRPGRSMGPAGGVHRASSSLVVERVACRDRHRVVRLRGDADRSVVSVERGSQQRPSAGAEPTSSPPVAVAAPPLKGI